MASWGLDWAIEWEQGQSGQHSKTVSQSKKDEIYLIGIAEHAWGLIPVIKK